MYTNFDHRNNETPGRYVKTRNFPTEKHNHDRKITEVYP